MIVKPRRHRGHRVTQNNFLCASPSSLCLRGILLFFSLAILLSSCEEVINIDLNSAEPRLVVEGQIYKDSVCRVRLTETTNYFSDEEAVSVEDAVILLTSQDTSEVLEYLEEGYYYGKTIIGTEGESYTLRISVNENIYEATSTMPEKTSFVFVGSTSDTTHSIYNPMGKKVITIGCVFIDDPDRDNFYFIQFIRDGKLLDPAFYLMSENNSNVGSFENRNDTLIFAESIFDVESGEARVELFSVDENTFNYFWQLNDILFWKRRYLPPSPYNPKSNISNGALGYFAAWGYDFEDVTIE